MIDDDTATESMKTSLDWQIDKIGRSIRNFDFDQTAFLENRFSNTDIKMNDEISEEIILIPFLKVESLNFNVN